MIKIKIANSLIAIEEINLKYSSCLNQLVTWILNMKHVLNFNFYSLYVRGSVAFGETTKNSDLDIVLLFTDLDFNKSIEIKKTLERLLKLYIWDFYIDLKIMRVDRYKNIDILDCEFNTNKKLVNKYVNFDVFANGVCFFGQKIKDQFEVYDSLDEFVEINSFMWGGEFNYLMNEMILNSQFNGYYHLIKRCIRLAAYHRFHSGCWYVGSTRLCLNLAIQNNPEIKTDLLYLYKNINVETHKRNDQIIKNLKKRLLLISKYLINYKQP